MLQMFRSWLKSTKKVTAAGRLSKHGKSGSKPLGLEVLESRLNPAASLPANYHVVENLYNAWQFDNHFLLIDGIGGYFGGPVTLAVWFRLLKSPAHGTDSLILGIGVRGSVLNMGIVVSSQCASECVC